MSSAIVPRSTGIERDRTYWRKISLNEIERISVNLEIGDVGGPGSGRWRLHVKRTAVEECLALDVRNLVRSGLLNRGLSGGSLRWTAGPAGPPIASLNFRSETVGQRVVVRLL